MKFEDCKVGMKVIVTKEYDQNKNIVGEMGVVQMVYPKVKLATIQFIRNVKGCWADSCRRSCWNIDFDCIEPADEVKLTNKQIDRYISSPHVQSMMAKLKSKYHIPNEISNFILSPNGSVLVYYEDSKGNFYSGTAKCHPDDKFDINVGLELAFQRLTEKLGHKPNWEPKPNGTFYYLANDKEYITGIWYVPGNLAVEIAIAIGNCFETQEEAREHKDEIMERYDKLIAYAKTLNK